MSEYTVVVFHPSAMNYEKTPFVGSKDEMLEVAEELQTRAIERDERVMYVVRPLGKPEDPHPPD